MIQTAEQFIQLLDSNSLSIESLFIERTGMDWDYCYAVFAFAKYDAKTFEELGFDTVTKSRGDLSLR